MFITNCFLIDLAITVAILFIAAYIYIRHKYCYWSRKGLTQLTPCFPFGNHAKQLPRGISLGARSKYFYDEFKKLGVRLGGVYLGLDPYLVIVDPSYAKNIMTKDFQYFADRGIYVNEKNSITINILSQSGKDWKNTRAKFTNLFTSVKMKFFFNTLKECNKDLQVYMENSAENNTDVNIYEVMACYFTDIIGSVIFGVKANSFKQSDATFRKLGRDLFRTFTLPFRILLFLMICYPKLAKLLGVGNIQPEIEKFMFDFVPETIEYRTKHNIYRSDFLQLLIELKNSGVNLSEQEIVAQSFLFFTAGFETSSATSTFILYELGLHKDIQDKVRQEVIAVYKKYNYDFTYESLQEMTYFNQVFNETTRKYPLLTTLNRVCLTDYQFPDSDVVIEKGTGVILPVLSYHRNADVFTDPEKWDPDRFEEPSVKYDGYFPFGDGPRNCIGGRFGKMQVMLGVAEIIRNYDISVNPKTKQPLEFDTTTFVTSTTETVYLNFKRIINID